MAGSIDPIRNNAAAKSDDDGREVNPPARSRLSMETVFLGPDGLRVPWCLLLYFTLVAAFAFAGTFALPTYRIPPHPVTPENPTGALVATPVFMLYNDGLPFAAVALATWIMSLIEGRPLSDFGFPRQRGVPHFLAGLAWGVGLLSLLVVVLHSAGLLVFDTRLLFGRAVFQYAAIWLGGYLLVGLFEEYFFRGYLQSTLARGLATVYGWLRAPHREALGFWTSAALISFGFGFGHQSNTGESPLGLLSAGLIGLVFCLSLWRTGSLWWALGFHAAWDWAQSFLYGVADSGTLTEHRLFLTHPVGSPIFSGGLTGPEGSIVILPTIALVALVIRFTLPRTPLK
jgi:membrane protease YdiL (CAAX protease family)